MKNSVSEATLYTPGLIFRVLRADATVTTLLGEKRSCYQTVADWFSFFSELKLFALENPLGTETNEGGYGFPVTGEELARLVKHIQGKHKPADEGMAASLVWQQIIAFSQRWSTDKSLQDGLSEIIWLELDICGSASEVPVPSIFFRTQSNDQSATVLLDGLTAFDVSLPVSQRELLAKAVQVLGPACTTFELGLMLARPNSPLRLNAFGLDLQNIAERLKLLGIRTLEDYPGFWQEFHVWNSYVSAINLDICTSRFGAKVGVNLFDPAAITARQQQQSEFWPRFLEWLVHKGWCLPHKKQAVLNWSGGYRYHPDPYDFTVKPEVILRSFSHVKLDFQPNQPPRAKAYLEYGLK